MLHGLKELNTSRVAVWSSISPWAEYTLYNKGFTNIVTVDYNPPLCPPSIPVTSLSIQNLKRSPRQFKFDLIVSFSGIEHDGLGRYGDPLNPYGDKAAVEEILFSLLPGKFALIAVPTAMAYSVVFPYHRMYGMKRKQYIFTGFDILGCFWDGAFYNGLNTSCFTHPGNISDWQLQPYFLLKKIHVPATSHIQT